MSLINSCANQDSATEVSISDQFQVLCWVKEAIYSTAMNSTLSLLIRTHHRLDQHLLVLFMVRRDFLFLCLFYWESPKLQAHSWNASAQRDHWYLLELVPIFYVVSFDSSYLRHLHERLLLLPKSCRFWSCFRQLVQMYCLLIRVTGCRSQVQLRLRNRRLRRLAHRRHYQVLVGIYFLSQEFKIFLVRFVQGLWEQVKTYPGIFVLLNSTHLPTLIDQFLRNHEAYVELESLLDEEVVAYSQPRLFVAFALSNQQIHHLSYLLLPWFNLLSYHFIVDTALIPIESS